MKMGEASEYTGLSKSQLYKLTMSNKINFSKPGGKVIFIEKKELDNYLLSGKNKKH